MKHNNFYLLLGSRLGLKNYPIGSTDRNLGVEDGAKIIFNKLITNRNKFEKYFPKPEVITGNFLKQLFKEYNKTIAEIRKSWPNDTSLISIGGDHSISYISLNCVLERFSKEKTGVIFFDSHADLHINKTSQTGNFHGMWMRTFFDQFKESELNKPKLTGKQVLYIGNLQTEPAEDQFIVENNISIINQNNLGSAESMLNNFTKQFEHIHITFDIDVFNQSLIDATGTPNPNGLDKETVFNLFDLLLKQTSISIDIVEYNPHKDLNKKTLKVIEEVINKVELLNI
jgi:arginase family enzyme